MRINNANTRSFKGYYDNVYYKDYILDCAQRYRDSRYDFSDDLRRDISEAQDFWCNESVARDMLSVYGLIQIMKQKEALSKDVTKENLDREISILEKKEKERDLKTKQLQEEFEREQKIQTQILEMKKNAELSKQKKINDVKKILNDRILVLRNMVATGKQNIKFENGFMIKGLDENGQKKIKELIINSGIPIITIDFSEFRDSQGAFNKIIQVKKQMQEEKLPSIVLYKNFSKFMTPSEENFKFINSCKNFFQHSAQNFNIINLVFDNNPEQLDENIRSGQRFYQIDVSNYKEKPVYLLLQQSNGYKLRYDVDDSKSVDLYLSNLGMTPNILWVDSFDPEKIKVVLDRFQDIKNLSYFRNINSIECPYFKNYQELGFEKLKFRYTADWKRILHKDMAKTNQD